MNLTFNLASLVIFIAIVVGACLHGRKELHVKIMKVCFVLDVLLLLAVELAQGAIEKLVGLEPRGDLDTTMLWIHVPLAAASLVWWILQLVSGTKVLRGRDDLLARHRVNAWIFLILRLANLVTAWMLKP